MSIEPEWGSTLVFPNSPSSPSPLLSQSPIPSSSLRLDTGETSENSHESNIPLDDPSEEPLERSRTRSDSGARSAQIAGLAIASAFHLHHNSGGVASTPPPTPLARVDAESPLRDEYVSDPLSDMASPKSLPISSPAPTPPTTPQNRVGAGGSIDYGHRPTFYKAVTLEPKRGPSPMHKKSSSSVKNQGTSHSAPPPTPPVTPASSQTRASAIAAAYSGTGPTPPPTPLSVDAHSQLRDDLKSPSSGPFVDCRVMDCRGRSFLRGYCTKHWRLARRNTEDEEGLMGDDQDEEVVGESKTFARSANEVVIPWLVYSEEGESHWKEWKDTFQQSEKESTMASVSQSLNSKSVVFEKYTSTKTQFELSPSPQLICVLTGVLGIQSSTGQIKTLAPGDCALLDDVKGKGHRIVLVGGGLHTVLRTLLTRDTTTFPLTFLPIVSEESDAQTESHAVEYEGIEIDTTSTLDTTAVHR
jgi:hypothetical protein